MLEWKRSVHKVNFQAEQKTIQRSNLEEKRFAACWREKLLLKTASVVHRSEKVTRNVKFAHVNNTL